MPARRRRSQDGSLIWTYCESQSAVYISSANNQKQCDHSECFFLPTSPILTPALLQGSRDLSMNFLHSRWCTTQPNMDECRINNFHSMYQCFVILLPKTISMWECSVSVRSLKLGNTNVHLEIGRRWTRPFASSADPVSARLKTYCFCSYPEYFL